MDYMEFLNKKADLTKPATDGSKTEGTPKAEAEPELLFGENLSTVQNADGTSVFNVATQEDLENMNFEQVVSQEAPEETNALTALFRNFFSFDAIKKDADKDGDGEVSADEAKEYLSNISAKDGNADALSINDLDTVIQENGIDLQAVYDTEAASQAEVSPSNTTDISPADTITPSADNSTRLISGFNQGGGVTGGGRNYASGSYAPAKPVNPLDTMSLEQLESEKSTREATLKEKQEAVNAVNNGSNENVSAAVAQMKEAETAYKDAVKNDPNVSKKTNKELDKTLQKITENQTKLDNNSVQITNKEGEISSQEESIKALDAEVSSLTKFADGISSHIERLQGSLSKLGKPTGKPEDKEKDAAIKAKKQEITSKIAEKNKELDAKKKEIDAKNKELKASNQKLEKLKSELEKLNTEKTKLEEEKTKLNTEKTEIETKISETCTADTKAKMDAYNKAVQNVEQVKAKELSTAKSALTDAQTAVQEVNAKINEVKNRKFYSGDINTDNIPAEYRDKTSLKTLPNGTQLLTLNYTKFNELRPEIQDQVALFNEVAAERGYTFIMSDGFRSIEESNAARARKGNMVAPGGSSPHNYGAAFDCGVYKNGGQGLSRSEWEEFAAEIKNRSGGSIAWGGDFKSKSYEVWHFELSDWKKYKTA